MFENFFPRFNSMMVPCMGPCVLLHQHHWVQDFFFVCFALSKAVLAVSFIFQVILYIVLVLHESYPIKLLKKIVISVQYSVWYYCQIRENSSNNQGLLELSILSLYSYDPNQY